jgi:hypothetical protein
MEAMLIMCGAVDVPETRDPAAGRRRDDAGEDSDDSAAGRRPVARAKGGKSKNLRQSKNADDSDSDFDM